VVDNSEMPAYEDIPVRRYPLFARAKERVAMSEKKIAFYYLNMKGYLSSAQRSGAEMLWFWNAGNNFRVRIVNVADVS
jgi:hypothetical protein